MACVLLQIRFANGESVHLVYSYFVKMPLFQQISDSSTNGKIVDLLSVPLIRVPLLQQILTDFMLFRQTITWHQQIVRIYLQFIMLQ